MRIELSRLGAADCGPRTANGPIVVLNRSQSVRLREIRLFESRPEWIVMELPPEDE